MTVVSDSIDGKDVAIEAIDELKKIKTGELY